MRGLVRFGAGFVVVVVAAVTPGTAGATVLHARDVAIDANRSNNWSGYNRGAVQANVTIFHSISGNWTVPTATQHRKGQAEQSSTWIGIGGGCIDSGCSAADPTLIQLGTEQDVAKGGKASYSAWWELVPAPSTTITSLAVHPGDRIHAALSEAVTGSNVWTMTLRDLTTKKSWSQTVPYVSTHATAEWIEETPLGIGTGGVGLSAMPNLSVVRFDHATLNGGPAHFKAAEQIHLVQGKAVATPSKPDPDHDGFNVCTYRTTCPAPKSS
jgi:Peptidase A4 family